MFKRETERKAKHDNLGSQLVPSRGLAEFLSLGFLEIFYGFNIKLSLYGISQVKVGYFLTSTIMYFK